MSSPTLPEYRGMMLPHIMRIMAYMNQISPPLVYPHNGPRENPRLPVQAAVPTSKDRAPKRSVFRNIHDLQDKSSCVKGNARSVPEALCEGARRCRPARRGG